MESLLPSVIWLLWYILVVGIYSTSRFRWDYLEWFKRRRNRILPGFTEFRRSGVSTEYLKSVFPSESFATWQEWLLPHVFPMLNITLNTLISSHFVRAGSWRIGFTRHRQTLKHILGANVMESLPHPIRPSTRASTPDRTASSQTPSMTRQRLRATAMSSAQSSSTQTTPRRQSSRNGGQRHCPSGTRGSSRAGTLPCSSGAGKNKLKWGRWHTVHGSHSGAFSLVKNRPVSPYTYLQM